MTFTPRVGLASVRHPFEEGGEKAPMLFEQSKAALESRGIEVVAASEIVESEDAGIRVGREFYEARVPLIVLSVATWSADPVMLDLLEECSAPVVTWSYPGMNTGSMCGCQQFCYVLKELGHPYRFVFGEPEDTECLATVNSYARALSLRAELRRTRMGLVGYRVPGMTEVTFDELELKRALGPRVIHYGVIHLEERIGKVTDDAARALWETYRNRVGKVSVPESDVMNSMKCTLGFRQILEEDRLSGVAVECYPELMGRVCMASSLLSDDGYVFGCEGDMNSTVAMLMLQRLTGEPVHNADPLGVDKAENSIVYSHCGSGSMSLAASQNEIEIAHVRLAGTGCCLLFTGRSGRVTLVNLVGRKGDYRMGVATGEAIPTGMVFAGNPTKVVMDGGVEPFLQTIADEGLGHHWMIGYGDVRNELQDLCELTGVRYIAATR